MYRLLGTRDALEGPAEGSQEPPLSAPVNAIVRSGQDTMYARTTFHNPAGKGKLIKALHQRAVDALRVVHACQWCAACRPTPCRVGTGPNLSLTPSEGATGWFSGVAVVP